MANEIAISVMAKDHASPVFDQVKQSASGLNSVLAGLAGGIGLAAASAGINALSNAAAGLGDSLIGANARLETAKATFNAFTKDAAKTEEILAAIRKEADITPFDTADMITAGKALISVAGGSKDALMGLIKEAEILAALNPEQGLEGAAFALKEAMSGDFVSIIERFNLSRSSINKFKEEGKEGIEVVRAALREMGADASLVDNLANTFEGRRSTVAAFFDELKRKAGEPLFEKMSEGMAKTLETLNASGPALTSFAEGIGSLLGDVAGKAMEFGSAITGSLMSIFQFFSGGDMSALQGFGAVIEKMFGAEVAVKAQVFVKNLKTAFDQIGGIFASVKAIFTGDQAAGELQLATILNNLFGADVEKAVVGVVQKIQSIIQGFTQGGLAAGFSNLLHQIFGIDRAVASNIIDQVEGVIAGVRNKIGQIVSGFASGFAEGGIAGGMANIADVIFGGGERSAIGDRVADFILQIESAIGRVTTAVGQIVSGFQTGGLAGGANNILTHIFGMEEDAGAELIAQIGGVFEKIVGFVQEFGPQLVEMAVPIIGFIKQLAESFQSGELDGAVANVQTVFSSLAEFVTGTLLPALIPIAETVITQILPALVQLGSLIMENVVPFLINAATTIQSAIIPTLLQLGEFVLGTLVPAWIQFNATVVGLVLPILQQLGEFLVAHVVPAFAELIAAVQAWAAEIAPLIAPAMATMQAIIGAALDFIHTHIISKLAEISAFWQEHWGTIQTILEAAWTVIKSVIEASLTLIGGIIKTVLQVIGGDWEGAWQTIRETLQNVLTIMHTAIQTVLTQIATFVATKAEEARAALAQKFEEARAAVAQKVGEILTNVQTTLSTIVGEVIGVGPKLFNAAFNIGFNLVEGLKTGISNKLGELRSMVQGWADQLPQWMRERLGIASPSTVMMEIGEQSGEGYIIGLDNMRPGVEEAGRALALKATEGMSESEKAAIEAGHAAAQAFRTGIEAETSVLRFAVEEINQAYADAAEPLERQLDLLRNANDLTNERLMLEGQIELAAINQEIRQAKGDPRQRAQLQVQLDLLRAKQQDINLLQEEERIKKRIAEGKADATELQELELKKQQIALQRQLADMVDKEAIAQLEVSKANVQVEMEDLKIAEAREKLERQMLEMPIKQKLTELKHEQEDIVRPLRDQIRANERNLKVLDLYAKGWDGVLPVIDGVNAKIGTSNRLLGETEQQVDEVTKSYGDLLAATSDWDERTRMVAERHGVPVLTPIATSGTGGRGGRFGGGSAGDGFAGQPVVVNIGVDRFDRHTQAVVSLDQARRTGWGNSIATAGFGHN